MTLLTILFLFFASGAFGADMIIGGETEYVVEREESLQLIGAKFGVHWKQIALDNGIDHRFNCQPGTRLKINTRKIVPRTIENGIIVNIADRTLYYFKDGRLEALPVGVGMASEEVWKTPTGKFSIVAKKKNPVWTVPLSIQREMAEKGKTVEETVEPGPKNPLGRYALQTSLPGVLIHETIWPGTVYRYRSHGCIRLIPEHMEWLFQQVQRGATGEIIYEPIKVAVSDGGSVYLEVRTDLYRRLKSTGDSARNLIEERGLSGRVDMSKVERVIKEKTGIAEDVTFRAKAAPTTYARLFERLRSFFASLFGRRQ